MEYIRISSYCPVGVAKKKIVTFHLRVQPQFFLLLLLSELQGLMMIFYSVLELVQENVLISVQNLPGFWGKQR